MIFLEKYKKSLKFLPRLIFTMPHCRDDKIGHKQESNNKNYKAKNLPPHNVPLVYAVSMKNPIYFNILYIKTKDLRVRSERPL